MLLECGGKSAANICESSMSTYILYTVLSCHLHDTATLLTIDIAAGCSFASAWDAAGKQIT